eukprot:gene2279-2723_t
MSVCMSLLIDLYSSADQGVGNKIDGTHVILSPTPEEIADLEGYNVKADKQSLIQVIRNVVSNAMKLSPCDTNVVIRVERYVPIEEGSHGGGGGGGGGASRSRNPSSGFFSSSRPHVSGAQSKLKITIEYETEEAETGSSSARRRAQVASISKAQYFDGSSSLGLW